MINPTGKKLQDLVSNLIDNEIEGIDKYTFNGSTWLIFTDQKRWVIEYTEDSILWYNYSFFTDIFSFLSMKATDNQNLIQEWFESRFLRPKVNETRHYRHNEKSMVEHTIQNGVKDTSFVNPYFNQNVEDTIQNGVKHIDFPFGLGDEFAVEDAIQNGVKHTKQKKQQQRMLVEDTIQNGVKTTRLQKSSNLYRIEDTIQNGVKEIKNNNNNPHSYHHKWTIDGVIQKGVKDTARGGDLHPLFVEDTIQKGVKSPLRAAGSLSKGVENVIQNGIKETKPSTAASWTEVDNTIENGVKETHPQKFNLDGLADDIIDNGVKEVRTDDGYVNYFRQNYKFNNIIENTLKDC